MDKQFTIGDLAKKVDLPAKTIRFYEEIGLIPKAERAENGYRIYPQEAVDELSLIKNARELGLPILEIKKLMLGCQDDNCEHTKEYISKEVGQYLQVLDQKIQQLQMLKGKLKSLKSALNINSDSCEAYCCNILKQLVTKGGEANGRK